MGRVMQIASFSLAEVTYAVGGDIGYQVQESVKSARFRVRSKQENVSGVMLPAFESYTEEGINDFAMTGLGKGGQQVQKCRETYARAVEALVELASLQTAFVILDEVIKVVNRRGKFHPSQLWIRFANLIIVNAMYMTPTNTCWILHDTDLLQRARHHSTNREHYQMYGAPPSFLVTFPNGLVQTSTPSWTSWTEKSSTV